MSMIGFGLGSKTPLSWNADRKIRHDDYHRALPPHVLSTRALTITATPSPVLQSPISVTHVV
ncbi:hypothetical protein SERLA73DRAFT_191163 [Serpula lacrymans var. lacrymans S7.3]|uniref:Uncharacterized protein n=1 Tax=Serpula lacrymans var. lacrymans (strain S7.3) TaxID=936435 RepID=F8QH04_SERL3|nr:hypothetical protein SERLA73DRAFT_191163 [Serpula lacrymans var. lacrymans S7.3]